MPEYLYDTLSGFSGAHWIDNAVRRYVEAGQEIDLKEAIKRILSQQDSDNILSFKTSDDVVVFLAEQLMKNKKEFVDAHRQNANSERGLREHGVSNWYDFAVKNWGTKWNAYDIVVNAEEPSITFDTAWSPPTPIIEKLSECFPSIKIIHKYFDEGHGFWGTATYEKGTIIDENPSIESERRDLCIELKGYDPDKEDNEDEP